jgi:hypothetical protein
LNDFPTSGQPSEPQPTELQPSELQPTEPRLDPVDLFTPAADVPPIPISPEPTIAANTPVDAASSPSFNTRHFLTPFIAVAAWIVPGLGHLLVGRWGRALVIFLAVAGLALTGFYARGQVFPPHSDDPFGTLGFLADACSGVFFVSAHLIEKAGPDVSRAAGDYGTRFVAAAGLVNVLAVLDACGISMGRRN